MRRRRCARDAGSPRRPPRYREPRRQPRRRGGRARRHGRARPGWTVERLHRRPVRRRSASRRPRRARAGAAAPTSSPAARTARRARRPRASTSARRRPRSTPGGVTLALSGADRRLRGPGGRGDGHRDARSTRAATPLATTTLADGDGRPSATRRPRCSRARRPAPVPRGTRTIAVRLASPRAGGDFNDGYVDNVSLALHLAPLQRHGRARQRDVRVKRGEHAHRRGARSRSARRSTPAAASSSSPRQAGSGALLRRLFVVRARPPSCALVRRAHALRVEGAFRIIGRYSTTTASGRWQVRETRAGTVTRVTQGRARVRDTDPPPDRHRPRRRALQSPNLKGPAPLAFR